MTLQTIFDRMMIADNELDLIAGGDDVTRGLTAVNLVQDWWHAVAATYAQFLATHATFTTTTNQETTSWPASLRRLDADPWLLDSNSKPLRKITRIANIGDHAEGTEFAEQVSQGAGRPVEYVASGPGGLFYWSPTPDAVYTIRAYGYWAADPYTAAANTFALPDAVSAVIAPYAAKLMRVGLDRDLAGIQEQVEQAFKPVIKSLRHFSRIEASSRQYADIHDT